MSDVFMITQDDSASAAGSVAAALSGSLRNTPDSELNSKCSGSVTAIEATTSPKDERIGSSASRFGNA